MSRLNSANSLAVRSSRCPLRDALRATTREWYEDAVTTRTVERTIDGLLAALDEATPSRGRARRGSTEEGTS